MPATHKHLAEWVSGRLTEWLNDLLGLKPYKGVQKRDPGIERLAQWVIEHYDPNPEIKRLARKITDGKGFHEMRR